MSDARCPALTLQLYTEDRRDAERECITLRELVRGLLALLEPALKTNHLAFHPLHDSPERRVSGSIWKATTKAVTADQNKRRNLIQDIITALRRGHVVAFHVDGDAPYLKDGTHAEVWQHLERLQRDIARFVYDPKVGRDPLSRDVPLTHVFVPVVPFYSIESWAYANTTLLRELLVDPKDLRYLADWTDNPGLREDVVQIKTKSLSIEDQQNEELIKTSRGFPREDLVKLGKSYADTRKRFADSPKIKAGLADAAARPY